MKMGISTIYQRFNDFGLRFTEMTKEDLKNLNKIHPFSKDNNNYRGWNAVFELHNGNIYPLIFWKGKLFKLEEAPKILKNKYYSSFHGKTRNEYEWTVLKKYLISQIEYLDKVFKKDIKKIQGKNMKKWI